LPGRLGELQRMLCPRWPALQLSWVECAVSFQCGSLMHAVGRVRLAIVTVSGVMPDAAEHPQQPVSLWDLHVQLLLCQTCHLHRRSIRRGILHPDLSGSQLAPLPRGLHQQAACSLCPASYPPFCSVYTLYLPYVAKPVPVRLTVNAMRGKRRDGDSRSSPPVTLFKLLNSVQIRLKMLYRRWKLTLCFLCFSCVQSGVCHGEVIVY
jgi:hypothetical protein